MHAHLLYMPSSPDNYGFWKVIFIITNKTTSVLRDSELCSQSWSLVPFDPISAIGNWQQLTGNNVLVGSYIYDD